LGIPTAKVRRRDLLLPANRTLAALAFAVAALGTIAAGGTDLGIRLAGANRLSSPTERQNRALRGGKAWRGVSECILTEPDTPAAKVTQARARRRRFMG